MQVRMMQVVTVLLFLSFPLAAQQNPYFVTYDHHMEEPFNLEISSQSTIGVQKQGLPTFLGQLLELEYGVTGWWSSALYLEGASQRRDTSAFAGFRIENRFKPLKGIHRINPLLYFEYENINEATRIQKEVVGHAEPSGESLAELRRETAREIEAKLILSSAVKNWNVSENFIVEKNLTANEGFEFGYSLGVFHPLSAYSSGGECRFCRENFTAGLEFYGGLGSTEQFGFQRTAQYLAPVLVWNFGGNQALRLSPAFGLSPNSNRVMIRLGYVFEINGFGHKVARAFGGR